MVANEGKQPEISRLRRLIDDCEFWYSSDDNTNWKNHTKIIRYANDETDSDGSDSNEINSDKEGEISDNESDREEDVGKDNSEEAYSDYDSDESESDYED